ncbi:PaaI family thioesterase [Vibrio sonorensis]|uniref:PaaI family thioesterase n=1 Tax=Vibrio sonorensis TaxID=1004316 RepID=UPI0008DA5CB6|nr:PaaI family thioesterase [Vibrio sonorensis]
MTIEVPVHHKKCKVCSQAFFSDTPIHFKAISSREITAEIVPTSRVEGYDGIMQGGLITALHDSAMLHCLFHNSVYGAVTVSLSSRFHKSVHIGLTVQVRAELLKIRRNVYYLQSQIFQSGKVCSSATSQFMV